MPFSRRFSSWSLEPNQFALLLAAKRQAGVPILDLTESNPTRAGFSYSGIIDELADPRALLYEPSPFGLPAAREAIARHHGVTADRVLLTASTSESYSYLFKLLCDPGDEVLIPQPSYPLFDFLARLENVSLRPYSLAWNGRTWTVDFASLDVSRRTRAILLVNPNNPTGSYVKHGELERFIEIASRHQLALISDEVFSAYPLCEDASRAPTLAGVTEAPAVCLNGLSKLAGLPQMKAGWMILGGPPEWRKQASERLELIADTYLSVSTPVQHALPAWIERSAEVRGAIALRTRENLARLPEALAVEGGWYAVLPVAMDEYDLALALLRDDNVHVQPGFFYDFQQGNHIVVSLLTPAVVFEQALSRIRRRL